MSSETLFRRINDYANRADPYPLYAELREHGGVARQENGAYIVGTYHELTQLLHDPRISSDTRKRDAEFREAEQVSEDPALSIITMDDPEHDRQRRLGMRHFGPPHSPGRIDALKDEITRITEELAGALRGKERFDLVEEFALPLPLTVICRLFGVPESDVPQVHAWAVTFIESLDLSPGDEAAARRRTGQEALKAMGAYLGELAERRRRDPGDDMLSGMATYHGPDGQLSQAELVQLAVLLLIAGHETTVNLISNGLLTFLRDPGTYERLRAEPELMPGAVEELLRYEPPKHYLPQRTPTADIEIAGVTVPQGAPLILIIASGNRDPLRFPDPDRFDPARADNIHLGFGSGIHNCFGAALARIQGRIALTTLLRTLDTPRLLKDPPEYRASAILRGPRHLFIEQAAG
ncbi:cytochrome P450 [Streptomyces griseocarneus]|nr:cytochrome P450 [Streptomyces griseocarneus]